MFRTFLLPFILIGIFTAATTHGAEVLVPQPKVDERVELLGIVYRLAGAQEYRCISFKEYDDAINKHFAPVKKHPVILAAQVSRSTAGVGYDAVMSYAVHISLENGHVVFLDENSVKTLKELDSRWDRNAAQEFAKQLDDFYVESRFHEFFDANQEMYQKTEAKIKAINDKIDYAWFKRFYGDAHFEHFRIVPSCVNEIGGYGSCCCFTDGHKECFAIICAPGPDGVYRENNYIGLIIHEFNHSFCNPLVEKYLEDLRPAANRVFPFVKDPMKSQAYGSPDTMLYEYLVRACEIRYQLSRENKNEVDRRIHEYRTFGFLWMEELVELLGRYEKERDKYPTLDHFMPEIVKMQNTVVTDDYIAQLRKREEEKEELRPKIIAMNPPNGAKDVELGITEISVTFDRPMAKGMMWFTRDTKT
jgi:hypothetical protein